MNHRLEFRHGDKEHLVTVSNRLTIAGLTLVAFAMTGVVALLTDFVFGIGLFNAEGVCVYGTNTDVEEYRSEALDGEGSVTLHIDALDLVEGTYKLDVAVHSRDNVPYDYHRLLYTFRVKSRLKDVGVYRPPHSWSFSPAVRVTRTD